MKPTTLRGPRFARLGLMGNPYPPGLLFLEAWIEAGRDRCGLYAKSVRWRSAVDGPADVCDPSGARRADKLAALRLFVRLSLLGERIPVMLRLSAVDKSYVTGRNRLHVLKSVDLTIESGEMVSIMGASGSGKSTLMNVIGLLDSYDSGTYHLDGQLMKGLSETRAAICRRKSIGFVFQSFNLIPFKTAAENVALPLYYQGMRRSKRIAVAGEVLDRVGLSARAEHRPPEMSGGEQQRVAIARALVSKPKLILADEPTGALDSVTSLEIMRLLQEVNAGGITVVVVTHERDVVAMTRRIIRLKDGRVEDANLELAHA